MRYNSVDTYRGVAIILMLAANFLVLFTHNLPPLWNHAQPGGILPLDFIAPLFGLAIGLCIPFTLRNARQRGEEVYFRLVRRVLLLFLIGYLPNYYYNYSAALGFWSTATGTWGILEAWALAYIAAFLLCRLRWDLRIALAVLAALVYQLLLGIPEISSAVGALAEGGPLAVLSWSVILVTGTVCGELLLQGKRRLFVRQILTVGIILIALGSLLHLVWAPADRLLVSAAYSTGGAGLAAILFVLFEILLSRRKSTALSEIGKYPLTAWVLQGVAYGPVLLLVGIGYFAWPVSVLWAALSLVAVLGLALVFQRWGFRLKV